MTKLITLVFTLSSDSSVKNRGERGREGEQEKPVISDEKADTFYVD